MRNVFRKVFRFCFDFAKRFGDNELIYFANALTYKLLLAAFPLIIFLITLLGFFNLDLSSSFKNIVISMPEEIKKIFIVVINEVIFTKNISILSISLLISIFSASSGFNYLIKGLNKAFGVEDMHFIKARIISIFLVFIFTILIIASLILFIFCDAIESMLFEYIGSAELLSQIFGMTGYIINAGVLFVILLIIFKICLFRKIRFIQLVPGTLIVVFGWLLMSKFFNIYVNNFSKVSVVYGGLGSVFILLVWLNIISVLILAGNQINAMIIERIDLHKNRK